MGARNYGRVTGGNGVYVKIGITSSNMFDRIRASISRLPGMK